MSKKIYIEEDKLMGIKRFMAGENTSHKPFIAEDEPPYEKDEFEIGGEGGNNDFFHVNENKISYVDLSEVGEVAIEDWTYDEEEYQEWLVDNELQDTPENKMNYIEDFNVEFEVNFLDNQTYHTMCCEWVYYDDLVEKFGDNIAKKIESAMIENGSFKFDTSDIYADENYDINNPQELNDIAMKLLPHGEYLKGCRGFILSNGVVVYTEGEHNDVLRIPGIDSKWQFIELGNIRLLPNSIDMGSEPTYEQEEVLRYMLRLYDGEEIYLDIFSENGEIGAHYPSADCNYIMGEINRYYSDGIRPQGGGFYESKGSGKKILVSEKQLLTLKENTFENWFGNSILKDENGEPIKMYHGTDAEFDSFSKKFIGKTGAHEGYGFNFTPYESRARSYNSKNVIEAYLKVENPMTTGSYNITSSKLAKIISEIDKGVPYTDTIVAAYEPTRYNENWDERYYRRALPVVVRQLIQYNRENEYGDAGIYADICLCGNGDKLKVIDTFEKLGYDSVIFYDNYGKLNTVVVFEPNQIKRTNNKTFSIDSDVMNENIETEVEASEVNLDSFKKQNTLPPKIWKDDDTIDSKVRLKLLDIADDFWKFANVSWVDMRGVRLTGSICNFNWSDKSDIDLHIVVDFSDVDERKDFVQEYFNDKKNEWNRSHDNLIIYGYPVELYVEDVDAETESGGIYDLEENKWIKKPSSDKIKEIGLDKYSIKDISAKIMTKIDDIIDAFNATDDDAELRKIGKDANDLYNKIKKMRKEGLARGGENDPDNIIYKVLRRAGYMDMLRTFSSELYDKLNSIDLEESINKEYVDVFSLAKERFGITNDIRECGYILPDGSMLDFSGRHMVTGDTDTSHLKGRRSVDHREIGVLNQDDMGNRTNVNINMTDFIRKGAIRIHCSNSWSSINLFVKPTTEQINPLLRLIQYSKGNVTVEIGDGDSSYEYAEWDNANPRRVINDVIRYFDGETVNLVGNVVENEVISLYAKKYVPVNEEIVADGKYRTIIGHIIEEIDKKKLLIEENGGHICDFSFIC